MNTTALTLDVDIVQAQIDATKAERANLPAGFAWDMLTVRLDGLVAKKIQLENRIRVA